MRSLFGILALVCSSCSPTVFVVDEAGRPIEDAKVIPMSRSFNWPPKETDKKYLITPISVGMTTILAIVIFGRRFS